MPKYMHLFETETEFNEERNNNYKEPWVSYTKPTSAVTYNKSEYEKLLGTPLTFEILGSGVISMKTGYLSSYYGGDMFRYRKNGGEWDVYDENDNPYWEINVVSGDVVEIEGNYKRYPIDTDDGRGFFADTTCQFKLSGNIMSLMSYALEFDTAYTYAFNILFQFCTGLTDAGELLLPATTLANGCYAGMFESCTSLTTVPELPATTLAQGCYASMFQYCTSLTTAPELPATTLANECYIQMFYDCSNLNYIKCLATDISASNCTLNWVSGVAASGTFVKNPNMSSWTTGTSGIPTNWTVQDAS